METDSARPNDASDSLIALARRLAEALEIRRADHEELVIACGLAWTLVDLLADDVAA